MTMYIYNECRSSTPSPPGQRDYAYYDRQCRSSHDRQCIDGSITGCGKCVGFCQYAEHQGFLTEKHRRKHNCLGKGCFYYLPKPLQKKRKRCLSEDSSAIIRTVTAELSPLEGLRPMRTTRDPNGGWFVQYVTITNDYPIAAIEQSLTLSIGEPITMVKLNYDFETAAKLIFAT